MNTVSYTPETMTAQDRRDAWTEREIFGHGQSANPDFAAQWNYGDELLELLSLRFRMIENMLGETEVAPHLLAMLHGDSNGGDTWREFFSNYDPTVTLCWPGTALIDYAGLYGLYGVVSNDIPRDQHADWVAALGPRLEEFKVLVAPDPQGVVARILNLALSRHAIDVGEGEVDLTSLAIFSGLSEGRIRNILSSGDSVLEKVGQRVTAQSAAQWLKTRKEFYASIWREEEVSVPEAASGNFDDDVWFVPVAADGSYFHPGLLRDGKYTVGAKDAPQTYATFPEALAALHKMATPRWRRPNEAGNWGLISGRDWKRVTSTNFMNK